MQVLDGKTAVLTGGASGIGLGIARELLQAGMSVAIT
jgi:NAD(P)-dependent dehydrogenase (short-subunit alcohol dehydrogenase family)